MMTGWTDQARAAAIAARRAKSTERHRAEHEARQSGRYPTTIHAERSVGSHTGQYNVSALSERTQRYQPVRTRVRRAVAETVGKGLRIDDTRNLIFKG